MRIKMIGIYKITNLNNGKIYIGQSNNIARRFYKNMTKGDYSKIPIDKDIHEERTASVRY